MGRVKKKPVLALLCMVLSILTIIAMMPGMAYADTDAKTGEESKETPVAASTIYVDANHGDDTQKNVGTSSDKAYKTVAAAVAAAKSGDTIQLAEGNYTLYGVNSDKHTKGKDLTFVGEGTDKTSWNIGAEVPDPAKYGTEYNGDYSFDGAGTITFKNMTLRSGSKDYLGFIRAGNTVVDNCVINGKTFYWGYRSAIFRNTTFNAPERDYAIWTYSSPKMTFDGCTFNTSGKVINVYTDYSADKTDFKVNYKDCTVNNTADPSSSKQAMNINDSNKGIYKYYINISGNNTVTGLPTDKLTCSKLFGFSTKASTNNTGRTLVKVNDNDVFQDGKMINAKAYHEDSNGAWGTIDHHINTTTSDWTTDNDGRRVRTVTKTCSDCGYTESYQEYYSEPIIIPEEHTITFQPNNGQPTFTQTVPDGGQAVVPDQPTRKGYTFEGWYTDSELTKAYDFSTPVNSNFTLYAKWTPEKVTPTPKPKPVKKKVTGILLPKVIAKGKHTQVLTWTALKNVDGYFIYTNLCDEDQGRIPHPFKKVADYKASKARVYTKKNLKTYRNYKYYVAAYKIKNGKKVIVRNSATVHSVCGNTSARSTNVKAVKAAKHSITLKKGQSYKLKASVYKINKSRAFLATTHCGLIRYLSRDKKIATVDYNTGKIKGVKAGTTKVYVLGVNGIRDRVTVTVK